jgi:hypothetical protein
LASCSPSLDFTFLSPQPLLYGGLRLTMHPTYPVMLVTEFEIDVNVLLCSVFLLYFLHFQTSWSTCYSWGKYRVVDHSPGPVLPWYHTLRFLPVGMFEWFCFQKFCGWHCNPSWKGVVKDILTHTWAQLVCQLYIIRATRGPLNEVDWSTHTLFFWFYSLQKSSYFYLFWLSCNKSLKNTSWIVLDSCSDNISEAFVESLSCRHHENTAECKFGTWNS